MQAALNSFIHGDSILVRTMLCGQFEGSMGADKSSMSQNLKDHFSFLGVLEVHWVVSQVLLITVVQISSKEAYIFMWECDGSAKISGSSELVHIVEDYHITDRQRGSLGYWLAFFIKFLTDSSFDEFWAHFMEEGDCLEWNLILFNLCFKMGNKTGNRIFLYPGKLSVAFSGREVQVDLVDVAQCGGE